MENLHSWKRSLSFKDTPSINLNKSIRIWCGDQGDRIVIDLSVSGKSIAGAMVYNPSDEFMDILHAMKDERLFRNINNYGYEYRGDKERWKSLYISWRPTDFGRLFLKDFPDNLWFIDTDGWLG